MLQLQIGWAFIEVSAAALDSVLRHKRSTFQVMICVTSPKCSASSLSVGAVIDSTVGVASSAATGESWAQKPQAMRSDLVKLHWTLQGRLLFFLQDTTSSVNSPSCRVLQRPDKSAVPKNRISLPGSLPCCAPPDVTFSCPFHNIIALHAALIV